MTELPASWVTVPAGDLMRFEYGKGLPKRARRSGPVGVYSSAGLVGTHDEALVDEPAIVIGRKGAAGKITLTDGPAWVIDTAFYVVPSSQLNIKFVAYQLEAAQLASRDQSTAIPSLSREILKALPFHVPPRAEQDRIVEAVEAAMAAIRVGSEAMASAREQLNGFVRKSIEDLLGTGSWKYVPLAEVLHSLRNGVFISRPGTNPTPYPVFRISAVRPMALDVDDVRYAETAPDRFDDFVVEEGDLLFTRYSGNPEYVGACALVPTLPRPTLHPDKLIRAVVNREIAEPRFLEIACAVGRTRDEIRAARKTTAGQVGIAGGQLKKVHVPLPSLDEQRRIVSAVERILRQAENLRESLRAPSSQAEALRRAVLHRAFTGRLVPQDETDEPALHLLERVKAGNAEREPKVRRRAGSNARLRRTLPTSWPLGDQRLERVSKIRCAMSPGGNS